MNNKVPTWQAHRNEPLENVILSVQCSLVLKPILNDSTTLGVCGCVWDFHDEAVWQWKNNWHFGYGQAGALQGKMASCLIYSSRKVHRQKKKQTMSLTFTRYLYMKSKLNQKLNQNIVYGHLINEFTNKINTQYVLHIFCWHVTQNMHLTRKIHNDKIHLCKLPLDKVSWNAHHKMSIRSTYGHQMHMLMCMQHANTLHVFVYMFTVCMQIQWQWNTGII